MTSVSATSNATTQAKTSYDPFGQCAMAHDFFGSQRFGTSIYDTPSTGQSAPAQQVQQAPQDIEIFVLNENPDNLASYLLNQHFIASQQANIAQNTVQSPIAEPAQTTTTTTEPAKPATSEKKAATMEDFYMATQIANQFSNTDMLLNSPYTSYSSKDFMAQNRYNPNNEGYSFSA